MTKARDIASAIPAPSTVSSAELGYLDGVTSAIQTQLDAKTAKSTLTTTGDIYYASAANTPARLAIGSTSNVLTVAGGIPSWAAPAAGGGMTLINSGNTSLVGVQTLTISSISGSYKHLYIVGMGIRTTNSYGGNIQLRVNGDTGGNYRSSRSQVVDNTIGGEASVNSVTTSWFVSETNQSSSFSQLVFFEISIPLYSDTVHTKNAVTFSNSNQGGNLFQNQVGCAYNSTSAISSLTFFTNNSGTGNFAGDSAVYVYGVN